MPKGLKSFLKTIRNRRQAFSLHREGRLAFGSGQTHLARECFLRSLEKYPLPETQMDLSRILSREGLIEEAIELCRNALEKDPDLSEAYTEIGTNCIRLNRLDEAIPWLEAALDSPVSSTEEREAQRFQLGQVYFAKGKMQEAREQFEAILKQRPHHTTANHYLKQLAKKSNKTKES